MRLALGVLLASLLVAAAPAPLVLEGVTLGEPMSAVFTSLGSPLNASKPDEKGQSIWRYFGGGGGYFVDVLALHDVAFSVTVVQRKPNAKYTDPNGYSFGMTMAEVKAKHGEPTKTSTNSDDGSVDLWYFGPDSLWIYEFHGDKLDFIQAFPSKEAVATFAPGTPVALPDGSTPQRAIQVIAPNILALMSWMSAYLAENSCGNGGHWIPTGSDGQKSPEGIGAKCSSGDRERMFYFDQSGSMRRVVQGGALDNHEVYMDTEFLHAIGQPSKLPSPAPAPSSTP